MAATLYQLFTEKVIPALSKFDKKDYHKETLNLKNFQNSGTETEFFVQFSKWFKIPIHLIKFIQDNKTKHDTSKYYVFDSTEQKWNDYDIQTIVNVNRFIILVYLNETYYYYSTFIAKDTTKERIVALLMSCIVALVEVGVDLLLQQKNYSKSERSTMCQYLNTKSVNTFGKTFYQVVSEKENDDQINFLFAADVSFPSSETERNYPQVKKLIESRDKFHESIESGDKKAVDEYLAKNPESKYYKNSKNMSACATAIIAKQYEIYVHLHRQDLSILDEETDYLDDEDFLLYFRNNSIPIEKNLNKQLKFLVSKTIVRNKSETDLNIEEIYEKLFLIKNFGYIFDVLCKTRPLVIIVDYNETNVTKICPYVSSNTRGLFDPLLNRIFISGVKTEDILGTSAHEMTHFVMSLVYANNGKPYSLNDSITETRFDQIVQDLNKKYKEKSITEEIIRLVFDYGPSFWHAELIVRVNHIYAYYGHDLGSQVLQNQAPELLKFYEDHILIDLKKYLRTHRNLNDNIFLVPFYESIINCKIHFRRLNALLESTDTNIVIKTESIQLTCLKLFQTITEKEFAFNIDNTYMIDSKTFFKNQKIVKSIFQSYALLIVAHTSQDEDSFENWKEIASYVNGIGKRFIFVVTNENNWSFDDVTLSFDSFKLNDFDLKSQNLILNELEFNFQGNILKMSQLIDPETFIKNYNESFDSKILEKIIFEKFKPTLGTKIVNVSTDKYITRFLDVYFYSYAWLIQGKLFKYRLNFIKSSNDRLILDLGNGEAIEVTFEESLIDLNSDNCLESFFPNQHEFGPINHIWLKNEIFIITKNLNSLVIISDKIIFIVTKISDEDIKKFYEANKSYNIHWLDKNYQKITWRKTYGSINNIQEHITYKENFHEKFLFKNLSNQKIILIAGTAGAGKSTLIKNLSNLLSKQDTTFWIPIIILKDQTEILQKINDETFDSINFLIDLLQIQSNVEKDLFKFYCNETDKVYLFLDGADEICPTFTNKLIKIIQTISSQTKIKHIIVTVRCNVKSEFENQFNTKAIELSPFTETDQIKCLKNFWKGKNIENLSLISEQIIFSFYNTVYNPGIQLERRADALKTPLQIFMLAQICESKIETFSNDPKEIKNFFRELNSIKMYDEFIKKKFDIIFEKSNLDTNKPIDSKYSGIIEKKIKKDLKHAAITALLSSEQVEYFLSRREIKESYDFLNEIKNMESYDGIIDGVVNGKPSFVHRTYAEYFFALFLIHDCSWTKQAEYFFFDTILKEAKFKIVRQFINSYNGDSDILSRSPSFFQVKQTSYKAVFNAVEEGLLRILKYLHKLNYNLLETEKCALIEIVLISKHFDLAEFLLSNIADVDIKLYVYAAALSDAVEIKHIQLIKLLIEKKQPEFKPPFSNDPRIPADMMPKMEALRMRIIELWSQIEEMLLGDYNLEELLKLVRQLSCLLRSYENQWRAVKFADREAIF